MVNIFMLVKDRRAFTRSLFGSWLSSPTFGTYTDSYSSMTPLRMVPMTLREWIRRHGVGEVIDIEGGTVTNALFHGSAPYLDDAVRWMVKLDNDLILCEDWLEKILFQAERTKKQLHMVGFPMVGEFFPTSPENCWAERAAEDYQVGHAPYTGGNFIMDWSVFKQTRHLGVTDSPNNYIQNSLGEIHRELSQRGLLNVGIMVPALPTFKLDKVAEDKFPSLSIYRGEILTPNGCERRLTNITRLVCVESVWSMAPLSTTFEWQRGVTR